MAAITTGPHGSRLSAEAMQWTPDRHMAEPAAALAEAHRVLRGSGRLALTVWAADDRLVAFNLALAAVGDLGVDVAAPGAAPLDGADAGVHRQLLTAAGFENVDRWSTKPRHAQPPLRLNWSAPVSARSGT
jgi:hypothetical protein